MKITSLVLCCALATVGCDTPPPKVDTPPAPYYICTGYNGVDRTYTFRYVDVAKDYSTTIKGRPEKIFVGVVTADPVTSPTFRSPGQRWRIDEWERPNELYFRVKNKQNEPAPWTIQFTVISEIVNVPKRYRGPEDFNDSHDDLDP